MEKYLIYGRANCPYCIKVVNKLIRAGKTIYAEMLDDSPEKLQKLKMKYDHPTIPIVILKNDKEELIGGCDDTIEYLSREVLNDTSKT